MIHFRRTLSLSPPTSTAMFSHPSTSSALRLRLSMPKLQCRVFENYLQPSPISTSIKYRNYSQLRFRKSRVTCMITPSHSKVGPIFHALRTSSDGCQHAFGIGSLNPMGTASIISRGYLGNGSRLILPDYRVGVLSKRFFSQASCLKNKVANEGTKAMRCKNYFAMNKRKKREKALAAQSNEATVSCISKDAVSAKEDAKLESSVSSPPITNTNNVSKSNVKKKPKSKKTIEQDSANNATAEADFSRSSEGTSQKKKSVRVEKGSSVSNPSITNTNKVSKPEVEKRLKSKKTKKQDSTANATEEASSSRSSEGNSQKKEPGEVKKGEKTVQDSELKVTLKPPVEVVDTSSKSQRNKKGENNSKKKISVKSAAKSQLKPIPEKVGKVEPRVKMIMKQLYPATGRTVVVVESVTKAKVIQGYLGDMFEVLPSYGHVRDLAARSGSVRPDDDFSMVWEVPSSAWTHLKSIKVALSGAENLILASDPDREGEAIAWHIIEMLHQQDALHKDIHVARVVFHEITEASIKSALQAPREIDENLVYAYLARRALDYLIGFNISPLLWKKLPSCKSAGRVQSAALALVCDREMEIDEFIPQEYWSVDVELNKKISDSSLNATSVLAHLTHFDSKKLDQLSISSYTEAKEIERRINSENFQVISSKNPKVRKNPPYPYITSTLQQDAANRLHFSATYTMKLAQKLYEGVELSDGKAAGLTTYMRTDGLHISDEAVKDIRSLVVERYGQDFASGSPRKFFKKVKNAQEAHEAIRPTDVRRDPSLLKGILDEDSLKLYTLIWCRTVACQMEPATIEQIQLDIGNASKSIVFRSSCSRVGFLGYQAVFEDVEAGAVKYKENEGIDRDEAFALLNSMKVGAPLYFGQVNLKEHHTQPPSRYSESSLVKKLEELGIGRPSTYASTLKVLQDREYLTVKSRILHPEFRGRMVSAFLSHHFSEVTDYSFTADMETELDNVSAGLTEWKGLLRDYWTRFSDYCERTSTVSIHQVEKMLEKKFGDVLFAALPDPSRTCPSCNEGTLIFKVSRFGAGYFIGCNAHPQCKYIAKTLYDNNEEGDDPREKTKMEEPKFLGLSPSGLKVLLKSGPYGAYVQLGEDTKGHSPKRTSVGNMKEDSVTLEVALNLLQYPLTLGPHPTDGQPVIVKLSKLGVTVKKGRTYATAPKDVQPDEITMEYALKLLSGKVKQTGRPIRKAPLQEIEV